ncbi:MAG: transposase [Candidatus Micrarchaeia archaeon]
MKIRSWKFRIYPSNVQEEELNAHLHYCKNIWNNLLSYTKKYYGKTRKFPARKELYLQVKGAGIFSQVAQNVADRLAKSLGLMLSKKKAGIKTGFPRFKSMERVKSFTYAQFGFKLDEKLELSRIGAIPIKKHRSIKGRIKTLTIKKFPSRKWFAIFTSEIDEVPVPKKHGFAVGIDLGIENFAYLSDGRAIENPRHIRVSEEKLKSAQQKLSKKKKGSKNRDRMRFRVARAFEKLANKRRDFLHKTTRSLVNEYSLIAMENLNVHRMAQGFLAKSILDCGWAEFTGMIRYKAEEAGSEVVLINPANTSQTCSSCSLVQKKSLAERWHSCICGASMHRDLNAAINILQRATGGTPGSQACREETATNCNPNGQVSSVKQEATSI